LAFDSDDDDRRAGKSAKKSDPSELGKLDAELPPGQRRSSMPPGSDADDALDATTLAALSKGQGARPVVPPPPRASSIGWLIGIAIGFAAGVPAGAVLFPRTTIVSVPAPAAKPSDREAQLAAAEARARAADEVAAAVKPLPAQRLEQAQPAAADTAQPAAAEVTPPSAAEPAPAPAPPTAASAPGSSKLPAPVTVQAREAGRLATAALNGAPAKATETTKPAETAPQQPQPSAAPVPAVSSDPHAPDGRSVDQLLDQALASSTAKKEQERADRQQEALAAKNAVPLSPSRDDVTRAMTVLLPAIRGCAQGQSGLATVGIIVKNDGHVETVAVTGSPFEGERSGRCMEGVVRHAKFPRFQQSSFRIQFPFAIQ
jgi:hypothetical protein